MTVAELCRRHRRIAVDSNVLIYLLEADEPRAGAARQLLNAIELGLSAGVLASVGLAEVLAGPARLGDFALMERYGDEIRTMPGLKIVPFGPDLATDAAVIRGSRSVRLPDAIHLATARAAGATAFVTNDRRLRGSTRLEVVYLDDLALEPPAA